MKTIKVLRGFINTHGLLTQDLTIGKTYVITDGSFQNDSGDRRLENRYSWSDVPPTVVTETPQEKLDRETKEHVLANRPTEQHSNKQVGGNHYAGDNDVFAFSLASEHDCLQHSATKYIDRHKRKNGKEDILKAISVCQRILKEQYSD